MKFVLALHLVYVGLFHFFNLVFEEGELLHLDFVDIFLLDYVVLYLGDVDLGTVDERF